MEFIMNSIVYKFGVPNVIVTDQGNNISSVTDDVMKILRIHRITTSQYNPRANGKIERRWRTMKESFKRNTSLLKDLSSLLPVFIFACNIAPCATADYLPFYLMMGYTPVAACIYKRFDPSPSQLTYAQDGVTSREEEILNILAHIKGVL